MANDQIILNTMKTRTSHAFTLLELLIVISIIALLVAIAVPVGSSVLLKSKATATRAMIEQLKTSIASYQTEYNRLPVAQTGGDDTEVVTDESDSMILVLLGVGENELNRRGEPFFTAHAARAGRNGLKYDDETAALFDPWGNPYQVILDTSHDNLVRNPDAENGDTSISSDASKNLAQRIAIYSNGPDGKPQTRDDIVSWR
jgi:prepilin-type N-terminal cleavage/methylation domain-containing protein